MAAPSTFPGFDRSGSRTPQQQQQVAVAAASSHNGSLTSSFSARPQPEEHAQLFATLIARCAKDIDVLIDSLPSEDSTSELQSSSLRRLEAENQEAALRLEEV